MINIGIKEPDSEVGLLKIEVKEAVLKIIKKWDLEVNVDYEIVENTRSKNSAIVIDFNEQKLGYKKFSKIVYECAEKALLTIQEYKK